MRISDWSSDVCSSDLPHGLLAVIDLVHKPVGLLRNQFAGARNPAGMPKHRKLCKSRGGLAEKLVYLDSGRWVVGDDIVPDVGTILLGFRCPEIGRASCRERVCQNV